MIGMVVSVGLARLLAQFLSGLNPVDPLTHTGTSLLWLCVSVVACLVPALRATRVDPIVALRHEQ